MITLTSAVEICTLLGFAVAVSSFIYSKRSVIIGYIRARRNTVYVEFGKNRIHHSDIQLRAMFNRLAKDSRRSIPFSIFTSSKDSKAIRPDYEETRKILENALNIMFGKNVLDLMSIYGVMDYDLPEVFFCVADRIHQKKFSYVGRKFDVWMVANDTITPSVYLSDSEMAEVLGRLNYSDPMIMTGGGHMKADELPRQVIVRKLLPSIISRLAILQLREKVSSPEDYFVLSSYEVGLG
jgi:hypothetical protein